MPDRAHHQPPLCPALHPAAHFLAHGHEVLIALRDQHRLAVWPLPHNRDERSCTAPPGLKGRFKLALGQLDLRERAQVKITRAAIKARVSRDAIWQSPTDNSPRRPTLICTLSIQGT